MKIYEGVTNLYMAHFQPFHRDSRVSEWQTLHSMNNHTHINISMPLYRVG